MSLLHRLNQAFSAVAQGFINIYTYIHRWIHTCTYFGGVGFNLCVRPSCGNARRDKQKDEGYIYIYIDREIHAYACVYIEIVLSVTGSRRRTMWLVASSSADDVWHALPAWLVMPVEREVTHVHHCPKQLGRRASESAFAEQIRCTLSFKWHAASDIGRRVVLQNHRALIWASCGRPSTGILRSVLSHRSRQVWAESLI